MWIGFFRYSAGAPGAKEARPRARAAKTPATNLFFMVVLVCVGGMSMPVRMVVVVHQFLRHVGEELARGRRRRAGPFDAAALAGGLEEVVPREAGGGACNLEALGQRGEDKFPQAPSVPARAEVRQLVQPGAVPRHGLQRRPLHRQLADRA